MAGPPFRLGDTVGQWEIIEYLIRRAERAKVLGFPMPQVLFLGPSGSGKAAIIRAIAERMRNRTFQDVTESHPVPPRSARQPRRLTALNRPREFVGGTVSSSTWKARARRIADSAAARRRPFRCG